METKKEEAIRKAYGDLYERYKNRISQYSGWLELDNLFMSREDYDLRDNEALEFKNERGYYCFRPKSLKGIENNNGWIRIESEEDLPKESGWFEVENNNPDVVFYTSSFAVDLDDLIEMYEDGDITHYKRAERSEKPIY